MLPERNDCKHWNPPFLCLTILLTKYLRKSRFWGLALERLVTNHVYKCSAKQIVIAEKENMKTWYDKASSYT